MQSAIESNEEVTKYNGNSIFFTVLSQAFAGSSLVGATFNSPQPTKDDWTRPNVMVTPGNFCP